MRTTAAIGQKVSNRLEQNHSLRLRAILLIGVFFFTAGLITGSLRTAKSEASTLSSLRNVSAVFLNNPNTEGFERWDLVTGEVKLDTQDDLIFITVTGTLDGPFFVTKAPGQ